MSSRTLGELVRFVAVGVSVNALAAGCTAALIWLGLGYTTAATLIYWPTLVVLFFSNRAFTFRHTGFWASAFLRFCAIYLIGYLIYLGLLALLIERWLLNEYLAVFIAVAVLAPVNFVLHKLITFQGSADDSRS